MALGTNSLSEQGSETLRLRVVVLSGSGQEPSHTHALAGKIADQFTALGNWDAVVWSELHLPIPDPAFHKNPLEHADASVRAFAELAQSADAFVWVSPIYHNSYSSHLKAMLDHLHIRQFSKKVVGLASHGSNRNSQAVDHLRIVARGLNAISTPSHVCTANDDYVEVDGRPVVRSADIVQRIERLANEVDEMTRGLVSFRGPAVV